VVKRGSVLLVAIRGDYGKVRPAVVVQADQSTGMFDSVTVCLITSDEADGSVLRVPVFPDAENGLKRDSWVQTEKIMTIPQSKAWREIGMLRAADMARVDVSLATHLNLYALARSKE